MQRTVRRILPGDYADVVAFLRRDIVQTSFLLGALHGDVTRFEWYGLFENTRLAAVLAIGGVSGVYIPDSANLHHFGDVLRKLTASSMVFGNEAGLRHLLPLLPVRGTVRPKYLPHTVYSITSDGFRPTMKDPQIARAGIAQEEELVQLFRLGLMEAYGGLDGDNVVRGVRAAVNRAIAEGLVWSVEWDGDIVAAAYVQSVTTDSALLLGTVTKEEYRSQGVGTAVLEGVTKELLSRTSRILLPLSPYQAVLGNVAGTLGYRSVGDGAILIVAEDAREPSTRHSR